jgi:hypothetical protein
LVFAGCWFGDDAAVSPDTEGPLTTTELAEVVQDAFGFPDSTEVAFFGPVEPGTVLLEHRETSPVELQVPTTDGTYYVLAIDDEPGAMFEHPVRYAWIDLDTGVTEVVAANNLMTILRPGIDPSPFEFVQHDVDEGVNYYFLEGEGAGVPVDISHKSEAVSASPDQLASSLAALFNAPGSLLGASAAPRRKLVKQAIVVDGGDKNYGLLQTVPLFWNSIAASLSNAADLVADWLRGSGFSVERISQDWANAEAYVTGPGELYDKIRSYGAALTRLGPPAYGSDNFYLYLTAHSYSTGSAFQIYAPDGSGDNQTGFYGQILDALDGFPDYVKVTIQLDNCFGGQLIANHGPKIAEVCSNLKALTLITSVDHDEYAVAGGPVHTSGTEAFMSGHDEDHDGDGLAGDIRDRFQAMVNEAITRNPQSFHCPDGGSWCTLDGVGTLVVEIETMG